MRRFSQADAPNSAGKNHGRLGNAKRVFFSRWGRRPAGHLLGGGGVKLFSGEYYRSLRSYLKAIFWVKKTHLMRINDYNKLAYHLWGKITVIRGKFPYGTGIYALKGFW